jgi:oxaloacetate decarboxylase alpha subunit
MAGLLTPYAAFELVSRLKEAVAIRIHLHCHATTGMATSTLLKAVEAGVDNVDTAISSMSMSYGHAPTESLVAMLEESERPTGLDITLLEEIAAYFRDIRKKYARFEGSLRGIDSRILVAQVPGGMLTNLESQLREQNATDKLDEALEEIPRVRKDLGYIPLVTPTSQIVGTQAVINVLTGERYKNITKETAGVLKGEYGATPAPVNAELQARVLDGDEAITCRPADLIDPELEAQTVELRDIVKQRGIRLAENEVDDVLTHALFPRTGTNFLENRGDPSAFEPAPDAATAPAQPAAQIHVSAQARGTAVYSVRVNGKAFTVEVAETGELTDVKPGPAVAARTTTTGRTSDAVKAVLAGNVYKVLVSIGDVVSEGQPMLLVEAMKMETQVSAPKAGTITDVFVREGDVVAVGDPLVSIK